PLEIPLRDTIEQQDTQPLPAIKLVYLQSSGLLTLRQVRERCGLNQVQLAKAAGVRPIVVDWCERGRAVRPDESARILAALAHCVANVQTRTAFGVWEGEQR
ncbi:MAG TPA: helix-turn-helix transcriptional regulator, partial [Ktedonobacteraceae bacterium]|nr:helix-turn-helix transcriptional regulator [Ktedonobacteraceae bacterium]